MWLATADLEPINGPCHPPISVKSYGVDVVAPLVNPLLGPRWQLPYLASFHEIRERLINRAAITARTQRDSMARMPRASGTL